MSSLGEPVPPVASDSYSSLTGLETEVVLSCCRPSAYSSTYCAFCDAFLLYGCKRVATQDNIITLIS